MSNIKGKLTLVTGGTRGIGLSITRKLAELGARVFICGTKGPAVEATVSLLRPEFAGLVAGTVCDVRDHEQVCAMMREVERAFGGLDLLVNNAGVGSFRKVAEMPVDEWRGMIDTNLTGVFHCCREAIPLLKKRGGGYIINIGSLAGKNAFAGGAAYNASKFGLVGFSEALMQEVRYDHIRVSYLMPGSVNTEFGHPGKQDAETGWKLAPEDVAEVVVNLVELSTRALASRVELRPSEPKK